MAERFRDFDAYEAEHKGTPLEFLLGGERWKASSVDAFSFLLLSRQLAKGGDSSVTAFVDFITSVVDADQRDAFEEMLAKAHPRLATFVELVKWIVEQETSDPLAETSGSPASPSKRGRRLKVVSPSQGSTRGRSHSASG